MHTSEDFSDDVEDDDDVGSEIIISGVQGECKKSIEGNYRYALILAYFIATNVISINYIVFTTYQREEKSRLSLTKVTLGKLLLLQQSELKII